MSRRPFSIAELAARSRPTGYDPSRSLKDLLRTATAERNAGDAAKEAGDVESAFIHYAKASTLMLEELPTHPKFGELNPTQKDAVLVHGQVILDSLAAVKSQVSERFSGWSTQHPDADPSAPTPTPQRPTPQRPQPRKSVDEHRRQEERRRQHEEEQRARRARQQQEAQRLMAEQERRQRALRKDGAAYDQVANIAARRQQEEKEREELLAEKKRQEAAINAASAAAFLGYPTPASLHTRVRPDSYESQTQPVSIVPTSNPPPPPPSAPPVSIPQAQHLLVAGPERSASAAGLTRTGSAARVHHPHPPTTGPQDKPVRAPSRTGSRADHHPTSHRPVSGPRDNPPARPGSRADHRPNAIRTDVFGTRNESAPAAFGSGAYASQGGGAAAAAAYNAAYGPGIAYGQNPNRQRKMSVTSPVRDRPPGGGVNGSHPPTTQAPAPRRRTTSHGPQKPPYSTDPTRANGVFPDIRQPAPQPGFPQPQPHETKPAFPSAFPQPDIRPELQGILPLESPSHTWTREPEEVAHVHAPAPRRNGQQPPVRGSSYPPPVTTTSPPPGPISYPNLMSHHQREQGYLPSTHSMFSFAGLATALAAERDAVAFGTPQKTTMNTPPSLLFQPNPEPTPPSNNKAQLPGGYGQTTNGYAQGQNPAYGYSGPSATASGVPAYPSMPRPSSGPTSTTNYATRPPPAVPTSKDIIPPLGPPPGANYGSPQTQQDEPDDGRLRQVLLPEEVIQKFMSIAKPNTLQNRETCGLLLGKKRAGVNGERSGFAVTTLLIPRQRGSSDMCEMVEEELILEFQEARGLITLGWIHTHPTQSCFMSSLDLHTHSGYQASLKEAFAIVCAPTQSPNVGIFRLTDPPGLQVILKCTAKEAFHPHSASSIYTDADQGHVKMMKKLDLSIVDLRRHST